MPGVGSAGAIRRGWVESADRLACAQQTARREANRHRLLTHVERGRQLGDVPIVQRVPPAGHDRMLDEIWEHE